MRRGLLLTLVLVGCREPPATRPPNAAPAPAPTATPVSPPAPTASEPPTTAPAPEPTPATGDPSAPPPTSFSLHVSFQIDPVVGDEPPVLVVRVRNPGAQPVAFTRFGDPRCFVFHHLSLQIARNGEPVALTRCAVEGSGVATSIAAGSEERMAVPLAELAPAWPRGTYTIDVAYDPGELARRTGTTVAHASQTSLNSQQFTIARPLRQFRVTAGQTVTLPDGVVLQFGGHSHKNVGPGDESPLIVGGKITVKGREPEQFYASLHPPRDRLFTLADGRVFELGEYAYGEWMDLRYFGRIPTVR